MNTIECGTEIHKSVALPNWRPEKQKSAKLAAVSFLVAGETGLEPATNGFGDRYSTN